MAIPARNDHFLVVCFLIAWALPAVHVNFSPESGNKAKSEPFVSFLMRRSSNFLQSGFAGCELPLYEICHQNVSRIQCSAIGCCFHKPTCYRKAVPSYVRVFIVLIFLVLISFTLFEFYRWLQGQLVSYCRVRYVMHCVSLRRRSCVAEKSRKDTARQLKNGSESSLDVCNSNETKVKI
ncbi:testis-expressed protein 29 isoform X1 [Struthio camelus]|uniref:testis-expressed protein 29 isoform X1 n=1 Tax=Struthio camelus TaxID=8801 RepID=UPI003603D577